MENNNQVVFKTAINGFDKKAVIAYIYDLNQVSQEEQKQWKKKLDEANKKCETAARQVSSANSELRQLRAEYEKLEAQLIEERSHNSETEGLLTNLSSKFKSQQEVLMQSEEQREAMDVLQKRNAELEHSVKLYSEEVNRLRMQVGLYQNKSRQAEYEQKLQTVTEKEQELERSSAQMGRLLLDATTDAERIRDEAREKGNSIIADAEAESQQILAEARVKAKNAAAEAEQELEALHKQYQAFCGEVAGLQNIVLNAAQEMQTSAQGFSKKINAALPRQGKEEEGFQCP